MIKYFFIFLIFTSGIFFIFKSDFSIVYGDSGFMWIQIIDLIHSNFTTFEFDYSGRNFDPQGNFLPFTNPFIGSFQNKFYIDFPPYFPIVASIPLSLWNNNLSIFLLQLTGISLGLYAFFLIMIYHGIKIPTSLAICFILLLSTTIFTYNLAIHEYSIAIGILYSGLYFFIIGGSKNNFSIYFSAILLGISLYFRLEFIFPIFAWILFSFIYKKFSFEYLVIRFGIIFIILLCFLFYLNFSIHGHPLGFRYLLTMNNPDTINIPRHEIILDLFFGKLRGFFYQSPYLLLILLIGIGQILHTRINKIKINLNQEYYFFITFLILILISITAPNHGDHLSPRYLFGIYPSFFLFGFYTYKNMESKFSRNWMVVFNLIIVLFLLFSVKQLHKNIKFIIDSDKMVRLLTDKVNQQDESTIVFLDQVLAKNLQSIHFNKSFYYIQTNQIQKFLTLSKINKKEILFISSEYSAKCILNFKLCEDRPNFLNLHFYKLL